jgi:NAD(P)-dependent dehydrogenase (short-subunit alcohol dehydrogenase family)
MKVVLISGASRGLGFSLAKKLKDTGMSVATINREANETNEMSFQCDLESPSSVVSLTERLLREPSKQYLLICNAASTNLELDSTSSIPKHLLCNALSYAYLAERLAKNGRLTGIVSIESTSIKEQAGKHSLATLGRTVNYFQSKQLGVDLIESIANCYRLPYLSFMPGAMKTELPYSVLKSSLPKLPLGIVKILTKINYFFSRSPDSVAEKLLKELEKMKPKESSTSEELYKDFEADINLIFSC